MSFGFRIAGWVCFLGGGAFFFVTGATLGNRENLWPWLGFFVMLLGMILTSTSNLIAHFRHARTLKRSSGGTPQGS